MKAIFSALITFLSLSMVAQSDTSAQVLETITVKAFEQSRRQRDIAAAVTYLDATALRRFSPSSIVQAINTTAGTRMEERSPGSYRINIRGSSLRSPFGVRNVKVYYNDLPITDPGGQTYLNALGFYNYQTVEIIKGPGSSLYGAGTGGVLAIESMESNAQPTVNAEVTGGSFGNGQLYAAVNLGKKSWKNKLSWQEQQSDGYRNHSRLERTVLAWDGRYQSKKGHFLKTTVLYSHLFYQTPGALTLVEYNQNRRAARPAGGGFPSAEGARAAFDQRTLLGGASYSHRFSEYFTGKLVAYASTNRFNNPAIRNYGENTEPHAGTRLTFSYRRFTKTGRLQIITGGEWQHGRTSIGVYGNRGGNRDTLQTLDKIRTTGSLAFVQTDYEWKGWILMAGASLNFSTVRYQRLAPQAFPTRTRRFSNEAAPRFSVARRLRVFTLYASASKGFSPPSTSELFPSGSAINPDLSAERGWNYEVGMRGEVGKFDFDINTFNFSLQNMVVQRRDAGGGDFYANAGNALQCGIESTVGFSPCQRTSAGKQSRVWLSHSYHHFRYRSFKQLTNDYSGKRLPGVAPHTFATGIDLQQRVFFANLNYLYQSAVPLNDANSAYAEDYHLLNVKFGMEKVISARWKGRLSLGTDNLLAARYSLGNDINAFGGRYYNAAPGRSFYISLAIQVRTDTINSN